MHKRLGACSSPIGEIGPWDGCDGLGSMIRERTRSSPAEAQVVCWLRLQCPVLGWWQNRYIFRSPLWCGKSSTTSSFDSALAGPDDRRKTSVQRSCRIDVGCQKIRHRGGYIARDIECGNWSANHSRRFWSPIAFRTSARPVVYEYPRMKLAARI